MRGRVVVIILAVAALAAAGIGANVLLLGYADQRDDPIGKLTVRTVTGQPATTQATVTTVAPETSSPGDESGEREEDRDD